MSTYREIVHMALDELKMVVDDSYFTTDHVMWLADKYRAAFLKKAYTAIGKEPPEGYYQTVCLSLVIDDRVEGMPCDGRLLRSDKPVPRMVRIGRPSLYSDGYFGASFTMVSKERMRHVGHDKWRRNVIYASIGPDLRLYMTSANPQHLYLKSVRLTAIFENPREALALSCGDEELPCDPLDAEFLMEEAHVPLVLEAVVKELSAAAYRPVDPSNNSSDDLSKVPAEGGGGDS